MPDNSTNGGAMNNEVNNLFDNGRSTTNGRTQMQVLESIEKQLENLVKNGGNFNNMSASNANNRYGRNGSTYYQSLNGRTGMRGTMNDFTKEFKKELWEGLLGNEFKKSMQDIREQLAKDLGVEIGEIPKSLGGLAGKMLSKSIRESDIGKAIFEPIKNYKNKLAQEIKDAYMRGSGNTGSPRTGGLGRTASRFFGDGAGSNAGSNALRQGTNKLREMAASEHNLGSLADAALRSGDASKALGGLAEVVKTVGPKMATTAAATVGLSLALDYTITYFKKAIKPAVDDFKKMLKSMSESMQRYEQSRQKNLDESRKRLNADIESLVKQPFEILQKAAEEWYAAWDNNLRTISATQGYTKEQVYELYGAYVDRLRSEGLTDIIGATDIVNNLSNVLKSGLQGAAAEEFAYLATKLNAAIPTQDFFNYTEGYITAVSNAMNQGKSQAEAIADANAELETFANSLLYAGREISGGFTVGLKGAESLFQKAEQIAQAGRYGDGSQLGSTLTAISAMTGAIAPDLAQGIIEAVYKAAVGGNASDIVALRSLAGINASNTEFLQALVSNPQQVFGDLFTKLSQLQNMSNGAYMEVAEGLSSVFGVSMDSLARIDFNQLASAVQASANPNSALNQNMKLLKSGQTTTNAEIQKMRQINQYIADEGLQYVLDSEYGRIVQQHEWDEQIARELQETTYGVEITGKALSFINSTANAINKISNFLNLNRISNRVQELKVTIDQESALKDDIKQILQLQKVGSGNVLDLTNLTTYNQNQNLTGSLLEMLGGKSSYSATNAKIAEIRNKKRSGFMSNGLVDELLNFTSGGAWSLVTKSTDKGLTDMAGFGTGYDADNALNYVTNPSIWGFLGGFAGAPFGGSLSTYKDYLSQTPTQSAISGMYGTPIGPGAVNVLTGPQSAYQWDRVGKSNLIYSGLSSRYGTPEYAVAGNLVSASTIAATAQTQTRLTNNLQTMLDTMDDYYSKDNTRTFEDFVATAKNYGIADFQKALEQGGLTEEDVRSRYGELQNQTAITKQIERNKSEEDFWENTVLQLTSSNTWLESINSTATNIFNLFDDFVAAWRDYFIEHTVYNNAYTRDTVEQVLNAERDSSETAIYALADALTQNDISLLRDPTLQTNALLSQILKVANAILVQGGSGTPISLPDTLAGLSLGLINTE